MTVGELKKKLKYIADWKEIFVAHDTADGEDILTIEDAENLCSCFIIYKREEN